jgi:hypothetical protein
MSSIVSPPPTREHLCNRYCSNEHTPLPPREQFYNRYCSNKHTHGQDYTGGCNLVMTTPPLTNYVLSLGYFNAMHSTTSNNRFRDHRGHTHHVKGTTGGQHGDGLEMMRYSLSQHLIMGRVFARLRNARGVGFANDLNIYASLKTAFKVLMMMMMSFICSFRNNNYPTDIYPLGTLLRCANCLERTRN